MSSVDTLHPLKGAQRDAADPEALVWLSASAGTGKTQVLTARVLRLLLRGDVEPENILCLTFTKAGAAEMANRIHARLARWVRMDDTLLFNDLRAIGHDASKFQLDPARQLFAKMLDAPGGGLKIMTIHSFCQSLLASFPLEAGMMPGFKAMEERDQMLLAREALAELLVEAETDGRDWLIENLQGMSRDLGEDGAEKFLRRCAAAPDVMNDVPDDKGALVYTCRVVGIDPVGSVDEFLASACSDEKFDIGMLRAMAAAYVGWGAKTGIDNAEIIASWIAASPEERAANLPALHRIWCKNDGELRSLKPKMQAHAALHEALFDHVSAILAEVALIRYAQRYSEALLVGKAYAARYAQAKRARGVVDFDDLIRSTARLLSSPAIGDWIRYKLDQRIDHILVDEAQDTNRAQWDIVNALASEYFARLGAHGEAVRTLFTVGDFKQAIFGFQGTSPDNYRAARDRVTSSAEQGGCTLKLLDLADSFRSTRPVLRFVDAAIAAIGRERFGLDADVPEHRATRGDHGHVMLLPPVRASSDSDGDDTAEAGGEEQWLSSEKRTFAVRLARQIREWLDKGELLASGRPLQPGDVMILVRSRTELSSLIVARLYAEGVPVSGIDRIRLSQPLAVLDLMAAVRFVLQPDDDLTLANLLVSPLIGWTQDDLLRHGYRQGKEQQAHSLWRHLRCQPEIADRIAPLRDLLSRADFGTPYMFLEHILSGPIRGRQKLHARLGKEALDPIGELLNAAQQFEMNHAPSLQAFLHWFDSSDTEIKREGDGKRNEVRVMTVHGAKGLQAPLVILADATSDPGKKGDGSIDLQLGEDSRLPMLRVRKAERVGRLAEAAQMAQDRDLEEHWRLLYVAMTRAEERLVIGGTLGRRVTEPAKDSWYSAIADTMDQLPADVENIAPWGNVRIFRGQEQAVSAKGPASLPVTVETGDLPEWLLRPLPPEARPPRPLAPSNPGDLVDGEAPPADVLKRAAQRGQLLHSLFERVPGSLLAERKAAILRWLARQATNLDERTREEIANSALAILESGLCKEMFGPDALAEASVAAVVGETVVAGKVDRLLVLPDRIRVIDFKTGRSVPSRAEDVPAAHLRQMAWYVAALEQVYPDRPVTASLLYTHGPTEIVLPAALLDLQKPR